MMIKEDAIHIKKQIQTNREYTSKSNKRTLDRTFNEFHGDDERKKKNAKCKNNFHNIHEA